MKFTVILLFLTASLSLSGVVEAAPKQKEWQKTVQALRKQIRELKQQATLRCGPGTQRKGNLCLPQQKRSFSAQTQEIQKNFVTPCPVRECRELLLPRLDEFCRSLAMVHKFVYLFRMVSFCQNYLALKKKNALPCRLRTKKK
jgi:hypothetical protein